MRSKRLILISCCATAALIASPAFGGMHKKSTGASVSKPQRMAARTTQVTPRAGHANRQAMPIYSRNTSARVSGTRNYAGTRYYGASRYAGTRYYGNNAYYGGNGYYYGGGWSYPNYGYSAWPYVAASAWPYVAYSSQPYGSYGYNPYSYYGGYRNTYSYYQPGYGYDGRTVAAVQRRLGELGYYHGAVDGVIGPRTRAAIAAFEGTHGMGVDGVISTGLLNRMGLA